MSCQPPLQPELERLRTAWAEGLTSGPPWPLDIEEIKRRARERLEHPTKSDRPG